MSFARDDDGAFHAFEAVLVAILITTAILYVTATATPPLETTGSGVDVNEIAETMLDDLDRFSPDLEGRIELALAGDSSDLEADMIPVLQKFPGFRYALRLDNGVGTLQIAPSGGGTLVTPRGAGGASMVILPNLTVDAPSAVRSFGLGDSVASDATPLDFEGWVDLESPAGSKLGPGGKTWYSIWKDLEGDFDRVPAGVPLGTWTCNSLPGQCLDFEVTVPGGLVVERPVYGLQLLIWDGAG